MSNQQTITGSSEDPGMPMMKMELAEAYFVMQKYKTTYGPDEALAKGTMFPELVKPKYVMDMQDEMEQEEEGIDHHDE